MSMCVYTMTRHIFMYQYMSKQHLDRHIFMMPVLLSTVPLHSLGHNDQNEVKHDFFSYVMITASWMASLCSLCEGNQNKVWHDSFGHVMPLAPVWASHDLDGIVNGSILFVRSRWLKQCATWSLASHDTDHIINATIAFVSFKMTKMRCNMIFFSHLTLTSASCDVNDIVNSSIVFIMSWWLKWCALSLFW